ncbi:hypothetical protein QTN25_001412 [Entamoeba marina]
MMLAPNENSCYDWFEFTNDYGEVLTTLQLKTINGTIKPINVYETLINSKWKQNSKKIFYHLLTSVNCCNDIPLNNEIQQSIKTNQIEMNLICFPFTNSQIVNNYLLVNKKIPIYFTTDTHLNVNGIFNDSLTQILLSKKQSNTFSNDDTIIEKNGWIVEIPIEYYENDVLFEMAGICDRFEVKQATIKINSKMYLKGSSKGIFKSEMNTKTFAVKQFNRPQQQLFENYIQTLEINSIAIKLCKEFNEKSENKFVLIK